MTVIALSVLLAVALIGTGLLVHKLIALNERHVEAILTDHRVLVENLCQRIQAPAVAVAQHFDSDDPDRPLYLSEEDQDRLALELITGELDGPR